MANNKNGKQRNRKPQTGGKSNQRQQNYSKTKSNDNSVDNLNGRYANCHVHEENGPEWYNRENTLVTDVTKIPFGYQIGRPIRADVMDKVEVNVPGILQLRYVCGPGRATTVTDGVNIAGTALFQTIRKDISTYADYAPADVMCSVIAVDNLIMMYNSMLRAFGTANLYSSLNYNYSDTLLRAQGLSDKGVVDFRSNMGNYIARFNQLAYKASQLNLPVTYSIIDRHAWLFSNVFTDAVGPKSQLYIHVADGYFVLNEEKYDTGTALEYVPFNWDDGILFSDALSTFDTAIERIRNSDSMNKIFADMRRALGVNGWKFGYVDQTYLIQPVFSMEVLSQIENTTILPWINEDDEADITQNVDGNYLVYDPNFAVMCPYLTAANSKDTQWVQTQNAHVPRGLWDSQHIINMHWDNPSSDDIAVATRNMVSLDSKAFKVVDNVPCMKARSFGADVCTGASVYAYSTDAGTTTFDVFRYFTLSNDGTGAKAVANKMTTTQMTEYMSFDWAPQVFIMEAHVNACMLTKASPLMDFANYTTLDVDMLTNMHNNIITSMWSVPQLGSLGSKTDLGMSKVKSAK